jgi:hypothetical protein
VPDAPKIPRRVGGRTDRLRGVLYYRDVLSGACRFERCAVGNAAEKMNGDHRSRSRPEPLGSRDGVQVEGSWIDVGEYGASAQSSDRTGGGEKREWGCYYLVAGPHAERHEGGEQGVCSRRHTHGVFDPGLNRNFLLECCHFGPKDVPATSKDSQGCSF